jgi:hypothetical protein|uniref:hypothetical protein n=1 Tax=Aliarcobacter sp. TaxID=2321116 RepID=UPI00404862B8
MYLFGFGSLININSAQKSFDRKLNQNDLIPVKIKGFKRVWNSIENIKFEDEKEVNGIFLNIQKENNSFVNGVIIKITQEEFDILKLREKNYSYIKIEAKNILGYEIDEEYAIAFMTTNSEKIAKTGDENCFIPSKYIDILTQAFEYYDNEFINEYKNSLENFPFPLKNGKYSFSDPIQNKIAREGVENNNEAK